MEQFNKALADNVALAPVEPHSLHFGSLACGHTNMVLRCLQASVPSDDPLLSENGKMSLSKLERRNPEFALAVTRGLRWKVLRWSIRDDYPAALNIIQEARNVAGHVARQESEMQGLLQLHGLAVSAMKRGAIVDWAAIKRVVRRSRPPFAEQLDAMVAFLATRSGGIDGDFLKYLGAFHRNFVNPSVRKSIPASVYTALADFRFHFTAIALMEAAWTCPKEQIRGGVCSGLTAGDIQHLQRSGGEPLQAAELALAAARSRLPEAGLEQALVSGNIVVTALAKLDIAMARYLTNKQATSTTVYKSVPHVVKDFVIALAAAFPGKFKAEVFDDLVQGVAAEEASVVAVAGVLPLYEVDAAGKVKDPLALLREKGFDVGAVVVCKDRAGAMKIVKVSTGASAMVTLQDPSGSTVLEVKLEDVLEKWSLAASA